MVKKAIKALSASTIDPQVAAVLPKYFKTSSPKIAKILSVLDKVDVAFNDNDYTYECEQTCDPEELAYTWMGFAGAITQAHIHICMGRIGGTVTNECVARSIVHEFAHRYGGVDDAKPHHRCKNTTDRCLHTSECPAELTPEKALDNADSYAGFAYELWPMTL
jgi:Lysine-specific metallo-endopeptidase